MSSTPDNERNSINRQQQTVTIYDVARAAGVTIGTVSKALNGQGKLRSETRQRVQDEALRLGFRPNDLAQSLLRGSSSTVGLISTDREGRFSIPLLAGINDAFVESQISVFLCDTRDDPVREQQHLNSILAKRVDGIIVTGWRTDPRPPIEIGNVGIPVLYAYTQPNVQGSALSVLPDDEQGGRIATEHLVRAGRRHFAHVTGPFDFEAVQLRARGMRQTLEKHDIPYMEQNMLSGAWREHWGREAASLLLDRKQPLDAIFCGNDPIARGIIDILRERGVRVPDDVAVVGFDNWDVFSLETRPPLTTVDMNLRRLGEVVGMRLLAMINGSADADETGVIRLPCSLVVRESCGAYRAALQAEECL